MLHPTFLAAALALAGAAHADSWKTPAPPAPSPTTTTCAPGQVWDQRTRACIDARSDAIDNDTRFAAVRELAYAARADSAALVLGAMTEGETDRVLTYRGFLARTAGDMTAAMAFYTQALAQNPDNLAARSYMAQGFVAQGRIDAAEAELAQIRGRGGAGTWAEASLVMAIRDRATFRY